MSVTVSVKYSKISNEKDIRVDNGPVTAGVVIKSQPLPNSYPNACMPIQGVSLYHFYDGLWYDPAERRTHDLPCERRTRYRLSQLNIDIHRNCLPVFTLQQIQPLSSYCIQIL